MNFKYRKHDVPVLHIETFNSAKKHARMVVKVRISLNMSFIKLCWYIGTCFASALENLRLFKKFCFLVASCIGCIYSKL
jgi:hypothetical protein